MLQGTSEISPDSWIARQVEELHEHGYTILRDVIEPDLLAAIRARLDQCIKELDLGFAGTTFEGRRSFRIYNLLTHGEVFRELPIHPKVLPVVERFLDREALLSTLQAIIRCPGEVAQPIHADDQMIPLPRPHVPLGLNCIWALSDFTAANGATRVIPGSHRRDHNPAYDGEYETIPVEMKAGSVVLLESQTWHGGGANTTDAWRYGISAYYCAGWVRPQENHLLGVPMDLARTFPRRLQELLGYGVYRGTYGHIANMDPIQLLGRDRAGYMVWEASDIVAQRRKLARPAAHGPKKQA